MRRGKTALLLLLSLALLVLGAFLPEAAGSVDALLDSQPVLYRQVEALQLSSVPGTSTGLTMLEKLSLYHSSNVAQVAVSQDMAALPQDQVRETATACLEPYLESGLMEVDPGRLTFTCQLAYFYDVYDQERYFLAWMVTFYADETDTDQVDRYIDLLLDDETGKLLLLDYSFLPEEEVESAVGDGTVYQELALQFCQIYLSCLDDSSLLTDLEDAGGDWYGCVQIRWSDLMYGEMTLRFFAFPFSLYNELVSG